MKIISENRKLSFLYYVIDSVECGIALAGSEVKSLRAGKVTLVGSFVSIRSGECYLKNCEIASYEKSSFKLDTKRDRKLLLHKAEIKKLEQKVQEKGLTLVPSKIYFNDKGKVKVEICLCRGKNTVDKRQSLKEKDLKRDLQREFKVKNR